MLATSLFSGSVPLPAASTPTLTVAAAADLASAEHDLLTAFTATEPRATGVRFVFAASGALRQQIENGAPYDVFLSANDQYIDQLAASGKVIPDTARVYALGQLGILSRPSGLGSFRGLLQPAVRFVAIANPALAPYGVAAQQALEHEKLWAAIRPKIVYGENVRQTLQLFESGNADVVLTAYSLIAGRPGAAAVPEDWHSPVRQKGAVVAASANVALARRFLQFLHSPAGAKILVQHGLRPVP